MKTNTAGITIRFWGVRGSYPVSNRNVNRYGGNTACVEVTCGNRTIILDCGTGAIALGQALVKRSAANGKPPEAIMLFSHLHHDHTQGFPFFAPAYNPGTRLQIYGPRFLGTDIHETLSQLMRPPYFPVDLYDLRASISATILNNMDILQIDRNGHAAVRHAGEAIPNTGDGTLSIHALRSSAHPDGVMHYRIEWGGKSVVYATDTEGYWRGDQRLSAFAQRADVLIHDAQYTEGHYAGAEPGQGVMQGYGHSTTRMACEVAGIASVGQLVLFHHAPEYSDDQMDEIQRHAQTIFHNTVSAYEGMEIKLGPLTEDSLKFDLASLSTPNTKN